MIFISNVNDSIALVFKISIFMKSSAVMSSSKQQLPVDKYDYFFFLSIPLPCYACLSFLTTFSVLSQARIIYENASELSLQQGTISSAKNLLSRLTAVNDREIKQVVSVAYTVHICLCFLIYFTITVLYFAIPNCCKDDCLMQMKRIFQATGKYVIAQFYKYFIL